MHARNSSIAVCRKICQGFNIIQNECKILSSTHHHYYFSTSSKSPPPPPPPSTPQSETKSQTSSPSSSSVSSDEVSKFSSMASTWWKLEHNPLISMNPIRMSFITDQIAQHRSNVNTNVNKHTNTHTHAHTKDGYEPFKGLKVLDVGCGGGLLSESMARLGATVTAIDPSIEVARAAQLHSQNNVKTEGIDYRGGMSVEELVEMEGERGSYDVVCVLEVIEHATDARSLMEAASLLLKKKEQKSTQSDSDGDSNDDPGGMMFVSTINRTAKSYGIAILGGEYISGKLPIGTHSWNQFLSPQEVSGLLGEFSLKEVDKKGMLLKFPLYDMRWYFDDNDLDVNWIGAYKHAHIHKI